MGPNKYIAEPVLRILYREIILVDFSILAAVM